MYDVLLADIWMRLLAIFSCPMQGMKRANEAWKRREKKLKNNIT
jgi:hypothetical protein